MGASSQTNKRALVSKRCKIFKILVPSPRERKFTGKTMAPLPRIDTLLIIWSSISSMHTQGGICRKTTCFSRQNNLRSTSPRWEWGRKRRRRLPRSVGAPVPLAAIAFGRYAGCSPHPLCRAYSLPSAMGTVQEGDYP